MTAAAQGWEGLGQAGHGDQLINNDEGPRLNGAGMYSAQALGPAPLCPTLGASYHQERKGGEGGRPRERQAQHCHPILLIS